MKENLGILVAPCPDRAQHPFHLGDIEQDIFKTGNTPAKLAGLPIYPSNVAENRAGMPMAGDPDRIIC
jgi:hypothetical protein